MSSGNALEDATLPIRKLAPEPESKELYSHTTQWPGADAIQHFPGHSGGFSEHTGTHRVGLNNELEPNLGPLKGST